MVAAIDFPQMADLVGLQRFPAEVAAKATLPMAWRPVAAPRSTVFFTQSVQAASICMPGAVVQEPPSGA